MSKNHDSSFGYFRWLLLLVLAGIGWFIVESGPDILKAGDVDLHEIMRSIPMKNLAALSPMPQKIAVPMGIERITLSTKQDGESPTYAKLTARGERC